MSPCSSPSAAVYWFASRSELCSLRSLVFMPCSLVVRAAPFFFLFAHPNSRLQRARILYVYRASLASLARDNVPPAPRARSLPGRVGQSPPRLDPAEPYRPSPRALFRPIVRFLFIKTSVSRPRVIPRPPARSVGAVPACPAEPAGLQGCYKISAFLEFASLAAARSLCPHAPTSPPLGARAFLRALRLLSLQAGPERLARLPQNARSSN